MEEMSCKKMNRENEAGTDVWVGRTQGGFALPGSHWCLGWAKPALVTNHPGSHVSSHGFMQDFGHSGEEEEDKSFREGSNGISAENKYEQQNNLVNTSLLDGNLPLR